MRAGTWAVLVVAGLAAGCASKPETPTESTAVFACPFAGITEAIAAVGPVGGKGNVHGVVRFVQVEGGVKITAEIEGLKPSSKHAFHVHEWGDATCMDGKCAGGHFNPEGAQHGGPDSPIHHAGDLGNLETDAKGMAKLERVFLGLTIGGDHDAVLGRSVIIHAGEDDFTTQPTGVPGDGAMRIGCGVIGIAKPAAK